MRSRARPALNDAVPMLPGMRPAVPSRGRLRASRDVPGRRRASRFSVHAHAPPRVSSTLAMFVRDIVDGPHLVLGEVGEDVPHGGAHAMGDQVPVRPRVVRRACHRGHVVAPLRNDAGAHESWAVRQRDAVLREPRIHQPHVVGTDLVAEAAGSGMDQHGHLTGLVPSPGLLRVEDLSDLLDLDEMVTRAHRCRAGPVTVRAARDLVGSAPSSRPSDSVCATSAARPNPRSRTRYAGPSASTPSRSSSVILHGPRAVP